LRGVRGHKAANPADDRRALIAEIETDFAATAHLTGRRAPSARLRAALGKVRRDAFVPSGAANLAYVNAPLPIGSGQTISQPYIVAIMTELLDLKRGDRVLEIGTGSGYQAAILAELAEKVYSVEVVPALARKARAALDQEGYCGIETREGDGAEGWAEHAPYDAIIVTAAAPSVPPALLDQLKRGGRMVIPVGGRFETQSLLLITKSAGGEIARRQIIAVAFVPLVEGRARDVVKSGES
jgi:protein-L-isoaspartate(D-aspartate) O-methyltransferase